MGYKPWDIDRLDHEEIIEIVRAYQWEDKKNFMQRMESARLAGWLAVLPYDSKKRLRSPTSLIAFPWEKSHSTNTSGHSKAHKAWVYDMDKKDIESGRIKPGDKSYEEIISRIEQYELEHGTDTG